MIDVPSNKVANPKETNAPHSVLGLATPNKILPARPQRGPWRDPERGHGKGKNPVLMVAVKPDPVFDNQGKPRWTGKGERRRLDEREYLPYHGTPFLNLHGTVVEALKLLIGAGEAEAARLLLCDIEQLTYIGKEQRAKSDGIRCPTR